MSMPATRRLSRAETATRKAILDGFWRLSLGLVVRDSAVLSTSRPGVRRDDSRERPDFVISDCPASRGTAVTEFAISEDIIQSENAARTAELEEDYAALARA